MPSEKEIKESVEICVEVKRHIDNATLGFSGFTARQAVAFDRVLAIAQSVLDCKGLPEERKDKENYLCTCNSNDSGCFQCIECRENEDNKIFNDAIRLCKLAAAKEKLNIPTVGDIERIIYNNKTALEAAMEICKLWENK